MRKIDYCRVAFQDLRRQPLRSALTVLALTISTVILVTMSAISIGGQQAIVNQLSPDNSLTSILVTPNQNSGSASLFGTVQQVNAKASKLDDAAVAQLAALPGVASATPRAHIWEFSDFTVAGSTDHFVAQTEGIPDSSAIPLSAGTGFSSGETKHLVILGQGYAKELGYDANPEALIGKSIQITTQKGYRGDGAAIPGADATNAETEAFNQHQTTLQATIVGVTKTGSNQSSIFIPLDWAHSVRTAQYQSSSGLKTTDQLAADGYTTILVKAISANSVKTVTTAIDALGYGEVSTLTQVERLQQFSTAMWIILGSVALIATVAACLGVVNTMLMAVSEQGFSIGVWRAVGATKSLIVYQFLIEAGLLGLIGGVIGSGLSIFVTNFVNQYVDAILRAQGLGITSVAIIPPWLLLGAVGLTALLGIVAGVYPALRAAKQDPSKALSSGQ